MCAESADCRGEFAEHIGFVSYFAPESINLVRVVSVLPADII
jgi:hypothetical protein